MSIQGMRTWIRSHRVWIIVLFVLLVISLLFAYSISAFVGRGNQTGDNGQTLAEYEATITEQRNALAANPEGYNENNNLAQTLSDYAYALAVSDDAANMQEQITSYYQESAELYLEAVVYAPDNINATGLSNLYCNAAIAYYGAGDTENAKTYFDTAVETDPTNSTAVFSKMQFLAFSGDYATGIELLQNYQELIGEDDDNYAVAEQYIEILQGYIDEANNQDGDSDNTNQDGDNNAE